MLANRPVTYAETEQIMGRVRFKDTVWPLVFRSSRHQLIITVEHSKNPVTGKLITKVRKTG